MAKTAGTHVFRSRRRDNIRDVIDLLSRMLAEDDKSSTDINYFPNEGIKTAAIQVRDALKARIGIRWGDPGVVPFPPLPPV